MTTIKDEWLQKDTEAFFKAKADLTAGITTLTPEKLAEALLAFVIALRESGEKLGDARFKALLAEYAGTLRQSQQAKEDLDAVRYNGTVVRAACMAGLITDLEEGAVGDLSPGVVRGLSQQIDAAFLVCYEVPGE